MIWGIVPAAGVGSRIQPLAFSKELLPVGSRIEAGIERPRAVTEHLLDRMTAAGVTGICFVISPGKHDIVQYFGNAYGPADIVYIVQQQPAGLCDAVFRALTVARDEDEVVVGLPDTVWFPEHGLRLLPADPMSLLLFPVAEPHLFDAVVADANDRVAHIDVKQADAGSNWIWGAMRMNGRRLRELFELWREQERQDEYFGTLLNRHIAAGGHVLGVRGGTAYVDVGTLHGYREALQLLREPALAPATVAALKLDAVLNVS